MTKTVEQLQAEALAAQTALQEAQEQVRRAEREAIQAKEREEQRKRDEVSHAKRTVIAEKLVEALHAAGVASAEVKNSQVVLAGDSYSGTASISIEAAYEPGSSWRRKPIGLKVVIGSYGADRVSFPQLKDGHFSYAKIAQRIAERLNAIKARGERTKEDQRTLALSSKIAEQLKQQFSLPEYAYIVQPATNELKVKFEFKALLGEDEARQMLELLKQLGKLPKRHI